MTIQFGQHPTIVLYNRFVKLIEFELPDYAHG